MSKRVGKVGIFFFECHHISSSGNGLYAFWLLNLLRPGRRGDHLSYEGVYVVCFWRRCRHFLSLLLFSR